MSRGGKVQPTVQQGQRKKSPARGKKVGGSQVNQAHPHSHGVGLPSWAVSTLINIGVLAAGIIGTWATMQSDIGNMKTQINGLNGTVNAQITRIDSMVKEWDRITRLEERLGNITALLTEIKTDLRDGRYAVRRDGVITSSPPGPAR